MTQAFRGEAVELHFDVVDCDGSTLIVGETDTDFTKSLVVGAIAAPETVVVSETAVPGTYVAQFTPLSDERYFLSVVHDDTENRYACAVDVGGNGEAFANVVIENAAGGATTAHVEAWLSRNGRDVLVASSCRVRVRDAAETVVFDQSVAGAPSADGHYTLTGAITLTANRPYTYTVEITDPRGSVKSTHSFGTAAA